MNRECEVIFYGLCVFLLSLFSVCSYVALRTFSPFIRKLTYDFTFPVHILRLHNIDFCDLLQPISTPENENVTSPEINIVST
jgi:hypothetical protein